MVFAPAALVLLALAARSEPRPQVELQVPGSVDLSCPEHDWTSHRCEAELPLRVTNHTGTPVELVKVTMVGNAYAYQEHHVSIADGETWHWTMKLRREGRFTVQLEVRYPTYTMMSSPRAAVAVRAPDRDRAQAACRACRGKWGRHGILGLEGCICRARDAGKRCDDGDQCQGDCLYRRTVVVRKESKRCRPDGSCSFRLRQEKPVGVCSEWIGDFGCKTTIPRGASRQPPSGMTELSTICSD